MSNADESKLSFKKSIRQAKSNSPPKFQLKIKQSSVNKGKSVSSREVNNLGITMKDQLKPKKKVQKLKKVKTNLLKVVSKTHLPPD